MSANKYYEMIKRTPLIGRKEINAVKAVLRSEQLSGFRGSADGNLGGKKVQELESLFCDYFKVKYAVSMNSATACLHSACVALEVSNCDVITTPLTFSATASSILMAGGTPVFADVQPDIFCLDPLRIKPTVQVGAILVVHLHGHPADMARLKFVADHYGLWLIEDASQAIGATYDGKYVGTIGDCGIFSFNQWKQISCGEGGIFITNNETIAQTARLVRNHGETQSDILGYNYRMTEVEAAIMVEQFKKLNWFLSVRRELAEYLTELLKDTGLGLPVVYPNCTHSWYTYPIVVPKIRDKLQEELLREGVYFGRGGMKPLYYYPFYKKYGGDFPICEDYYRDVMFTDVIRPQATMRDMRFIARKIKEALWRIDTSAR